MITWENAVHVAEANIMRVQCVILERNRVRECETFLISIKAMSAAFIPDYTIY